MYSAGCNYTRITKFIKLSSVMLTVSNTTQTRIARLSSVYVPFSPSCSNFMCPSMWNCKKRDNFMCLLEFECAKRLRAHSQAIPAQTLKPFHCWTVWRKHQNIFTFSIISQNRRTVRVQEFFHIEQEDNTYSSINTMNVIGQWHKSPARSHGKTYYASAA